MPKSRKRKTRRGGSASRSTRSSRNLAARARKKIAVVAIASLAIAGVLLAGLLFIFGGRGNSAPAPAPGTEVTTPSGLKYIDEVVGTGQSPKPFQNVTVHYTGTLENGTKFDSSVDRGQPFSFLIGTHAVIQGWDEGLMTMKVGGKRRLIIPPSLGYGGVSKPAIPANSTLIFEVELLGVQ